MPAAGASGGYQARCAGVRRRQGRLLGRIETLGFDLRREAVLGTLVEDVVKSSNIDHGLLARNPGGGRNTNHRPVTDSRRAGD